MQTNKVSEIIVIKYNIEKYVYVIIVYRFETTFPETPQTQVMLQHQRFSDINFFGSSNIR